MYKLQYTNEEIHLVDKKLQVKLVANEHVLIFVPLRNIVRALR